ncbi:MAG: DNA translocase FtsK 4TM domain-containing protein [Oceanospirillaceae bacterium]|nr:DNA translocase FtsK 4TM domain-containing protein [Oceanospirillaceae bacterium]
MLKNKHKVQINWQEQKRLALREGGALLLCLLALFGLLALLSYHPQDGGWRGSSDGMNIRNWGGVLGAFVADVLFSFVGYMAYLVPLLPLYHLLRRYWTNVELENHWGGFYWRLFGFTLILLSGAALSGFHDVRDTLLPYGTGGIIGQSMASWFGAQIGGVGASLFFFAVFLFGLTVFGDISWLGTMDAIGAYILRLIDEKWGEKNGATRVAEPLRGPRVEPVALRDEVLPVRREPVIDVDIDEDESDEPLIPELTQVVPPTLKKPADIPPVRPVAPPVAVMPPVILDDKKPVVIQPFEKKSAGPATVQGSLFKTDGLPDLSLLNRSSKAQSGGFSAENLEDMSRLLERKLLDFGVKVEVVAVNPGPVITRFEIQPAPGVKASKISNLAKDLARSLAMVSVRVVEVIPGKSVMGIEIPNDDREIVYLGDVFASAEYQSAKSPLTLALGHDIAGDPVTADLAKMPHLLVAGTTGSGKSVGVNAMLLSMLYKAGPDEVRMIMVDPKMLELSVYDGIPHLLTPVITDMKEAANGLRWCVAEMERRYKLMAAMGVRNLAGYNKKITDAAQAGEVIYDPLWKPGSNFEDKAEALGKLPYIVVVVDEFADMIMVVGKKVEELIARIAQKARAAGIHLILATQRPSVDVITGLIKANVPTRIAFQVSSKIDSRTILDQGGAEQLLGHGDMLYLPPGTAVPIRVHGAFVADDEVHRVVADWKTRGEPEYIEITSSTSSSEGGGGGDEGDPESDELYDEAVAFVLETRKVSISSVQRKLRIGYNRAARLVEAMEQSGLVSPPGNNGNREVLTPEH